MEINKDGRTLYFSDEELDNETTGEKKVFVTKRINGKESHVKASKIKKENKRDTKKENERKEKFNFNDEIVIGVNFIKPAKNEEEEKIKNKKEPYKVFSEIIVTKKEILIANKKDIIILK